MGNSQGITVTKRAPVITYLVFANGNITFERANEIEATIIIMNIQMSLYGQKVNLNKWYVSLAKVDEKDSIWRELGNQRGTTP